MINKKMSPTIIAAFIGGVFVLCAALITPIIERLLNPKQEISVTSDMPIQTDVIESQVTSLATNTDIPIASLTLEPYATVHSDLPGTPLVSGVKITSVLDRDTKPRDVYSIELNAFQRVYVEVDNPHALELYYVKPGISYSDEPNWVFMLGATGVRYKFFDAAISGTYYLVAKAYSNGGKYELVIRIE